VEGFCLRVFLFFLRERGGGLGWWGVGSGKWEWGARGAVLVRREPFGGRGAVTRTCDSFGAGAQTADGPLGAVLHPPWV
jgi:hypothetical protein